MQPPLSGVRVVELAGIGPAPFCGMLLADLGADVLRVERPDVAVDPGNEAMCRGKARVELDLKEPSGVETLLALAERVDVLVEGYRPGVAERLGIGPDACRARNPRLVYGRMTGWGRTGPYAEAAGHDIDYIALTGALHAIGRPPLNLVGDFGGGGLVLALGIVAALHRGEGCVVDAAMNDGAALLMTSTYALRNAGLWPAPPGGNLLDGGAPFYSTYETADGKRVAVGAIEPRFYAELLRLLGLEELGGQMDADAWPAIRAGLAERFRTRTRDEWEAHFAGSSACVAPVLDLDEAPRHPHNRARGTFRDTAEGPLPAPAPLFDGERPPFREPPPLAAFGLDDDGRLARR